MRRQRRRFGFLRISTAANPKRRRATLAAALQISFSAAFYQALGYALDVKTAFDLGCAQIDLENLDEQDTPKLLAINADPTNITFVGQGS